MTFLRPAVHSVLFSVVLTGCGVGTVTEDNFAEKAGQVECQILSKCMRAYYESEYSDMADCRDEVNDDYSDLADDLDDRGCDFDEDEAQDCLDTVSTLTCEEYWEDVVEEGGRHKDCDKVWDCD